MPARSVRDAQNEGRANRILAALPSSAYRRMSGKLEPVSLELGQVLSQPGAATSHVYFPSNSLISLIAVAAGGKPIEVGMIGRQGMCGVSLALGVTSSPARALVQGAGQAMRMSARAFVAELKHNEALRRGAARYANTSMVTAMQIAACNNAHAIGERLARWILMTSDYLGLNTFYLTHGFLAQMLGVRRPGVTAAASALQKEGLVRYRRGMLTILNRGGLRAVSCGCYDSIRQLAPA